MTMIEAILKEFDYDEDRLWFWIEFEEDMFPEGAKRTNEQVEKYNCVLEWLNS